MNERTRLQGKALVVGGVVFASLVGLIFFAGCEKEEPAVQESQPVEQATAAAEHPTSEHPSAEHPTAEHPTVEAVTAQEMCPIMDAPINKALFVEYQGKKVYFCCPGCKEKFLANPEQYVAKLPQFQQ